MGAAERLLVPRNESAILQMIEHYVARKSFFYVTGSIDSEKVVSLAEKFAGRYPTILATSRERTAAKKLKAPRVNLFLWPQRFVGKWTFLLASDRPLHGEKMHDCRRTSNRIIVNGRTTGYVNARRASGAWTWKLSEESYMYWRDQLNTAAQRGSGTLLQKHIDTLLRTTYMAGGVRTQVFSLLNEVKRTYENHRTPGRQHDVDLVVPKTIVKARRMKWYSNPPVTLSAAVEAKMELDRQTLIQLDYEWELHVQRAEAAGWPI